MKAAIGLLDPEKTAKEFLDGKSVNIQIDRNELEILAEEVEVRMQAKEGFVVASEGGYLAALVTDITDDLRKEGFAREFVRRVQEARKQAELDISDRISLFYTASTDLASAIEDHMDFIKTETLTVEMDSENSPNTLPNASEEFDGETLAIWIEKKS